MPEEQTGAPSGESSGTPPVPDPSLGGTPPSATFTQEQLTAIAAREKAQGERGARKALLDKFGFSSQEDMDRFVTAARDTEKAAMTDAERLKAEAQAELAQARTDREAMAVERHSNAVERELIKAGAPLDKTSRLARLVDVDLGSDLAAVTTAVEAVKAEFPQMFGSPTAPGAPSPGSEPTSGGPPPTRSNGMTALERGREAAKQRTSRT